MGRIIPGIRRALRIPDPVEEQVPREVDEELDYHIARLAEELRRAESLSAEEAVAAARARFGDVAAAREYMIRASTPVERRRRVARWLDEARQDLAFAGRTLRRNRGHTALVVLTLGVGIAANGTVFSLMDPYLFRPLPFEDPDRLAALFVTDRATGWQQARVSLQQLEDWERRSAAMEDVGAYVYGEVNLGGPEGPEQVMRTLMTANLWEILGAPAAKGRVFVAGEDGPGGADVAVISHQLWMRRYAGDPAIVGRSIQVDGTPFTVVGVMPESFNFPWNEVRIWTPLRASPVTQERQVTAYMPVARLKDGWTREALQRDLTAIHRDLAEAHPDVDGRFSGVNVLPLRQALSFAWEPVRMASLALGGSVVFMLLIVCINVAGLVLARGEARAAEMGIRRALGAGQRRLVRQLLTEGSLLAVGGGLVGVGLAWLAVRAIGPALPEAVFRVGSAEIDGRVLLFTAAVTLLTPLVFALAPALRFGRISGATLLRESTGGSRSLREARGQRRLVAAQIALAAALAAGAGLMVRSFTAARSVDVGFDRSGLATMVVRPPQSAYPDQAALEAYYQRVVDAVAARPEVSAVTTVAPMPLSHATWSTEVSVPGYEPAADEQPIAVDLHVADGYFTAMGIPLLAGRVLDRRDGADAAPAVVISRTMAERYWPGGEAVGREVVLGRGEHVRAYTVVGVVGDVSHQSVTAPPAPQVYRTFAQAPARGRWVVARGRSGEPPTAAAAAAVLSVDPELPGGDMKTMDRVILEHTFHWGIVSGMLAVFGLVATLLASLGVYGVASYSVARRRRELGVRAALGAGAGALRGLVLREGLALAGRGIAVGLALAVALGFVLSWALYGVSPWDPVALTAAVVPFVGAVLLATLPPALRAARVQPQEVLRVE